MSVQEKRELAIALGLKPEATHAEMLEAAQRLRNRERVRLVLERPGPAPSHVGPAFQQPAIIGVGDVPDAFPRLICAEKPRFS